MQIFRIKKTSCKGKIGPAERNVLDARTSYWFRNSESFSIPKT